MDSTAEVRTVGRIASERVHHFLHAPERQDGGRSGPVKTQRASRFERLIFIAGQGDIDAAGNICDPNRLAPQVRSAMAAVARAVEEIGASSRDIVKLVVFHTADTVDGEAEILREIRAQTACDIPPVVSLVALPRLAVPGLTILIKAVAIDNADGLAPRRIASGSGAWPRGGEFSDGLRCGEFTFISAQSAKDRSGAVQHHDDVAAQARLTIENIAGVLQALDCDLDDVVKLNTWYVGFGTDADWRAAAEVRGNAFRFPGPGATGVPVPHRYPDGSLIRQECLALRSLDGSRLPRSLSWPLGHWDWPIRVSFQQGIRVGRLIVLGGQYSMDERGLAVAPDDMDRQIDNTMEFISRILRGFGAGLEHLVEVTAFYKHDSIGSGTPLAGVRFGPERPPVTEVPLATMGLERVTLEVEGYAITPDY